MARDFRKGKKQYAERITRPPSRIPAESWESGTHAFYSVASSTQGSWRPYHSILLLLGSLKLQFNQPAPLLAGSFHSFPQRDHPLAPCPTPAPGADLKELIDFAEVDPLLGIQFVNVTDVSIHQVETKTHDLEWEEAEASHIHWKSFKQPTKADLCLCSHPV